MPLMNPAWSRTPIHAHTCLLRVATLHLLACAQFVTAPSSHLLSRLARTAAWYLPLAEYKSSVPISAWFQKQLKGCHHMRKQSASKTKGITHEVTKKIWNDEMLQNTTNASVRYRGYITFQALVLCQRCVRECGQRYEPR
jgi:hypothetical protein